MLELDKSSLWELSSKPSVPEAVAQVAAACVVLCAGKAPGMADDLSWSETAEHLRSYPQQMRSLDIAAIATNELTTYLERNYLEAPLFEPERIARSLRGQGMEEEPTRVTATLATWCIATIKEMRRHRKQHAQSQEGAAVAKELEAARAELAPLYADRGDEPAAPAASADADEGGLFSKTLSFLLDPEPPAPAVAADAAAGPGCRVALPWDVDTSASPDISAAWTALELDVGRIIRGLVGEVLQLSGTAGASVETELGAAPWAWRWDEDVRYTQTGTADGGERLGCSTQVDSWSLRPRLYPRVGKGAGVLSDAASELLESAECRMSAASVLRETESGDLLDLRLEISDGSGGVAQDGAAVARACGALLGLPESTAVGAPLLRKLLSMEVVQEGLAEAEEALRGVKQSDLERRAEALGPGAARALAALGGWAFAAVRAGRAAERAATSHGGVAGASWPHVYSERAAQLRLLRAASGSGGPRVVAPLGDAAVLCSETACAAL